MSAPSLLPDFDAHEGVHVFHDDASGLRAIIAIHSTALGPAAGGVRWLHYADDIAAMTDALRLSRGMSYKNAMAGLPMGGGKGVILADAAGHRTPAMLRAFGDAIETLGGRYVTAEDVGMGEGDMAIIAERTAHVSGRAVAAGQGGGDPGPATARGVYLGIRATARRLFGGDDLRGVRIAIQGVGSVGGRLARRLADDGAVLTLADRDAVRAAALAGTLGAALADPAEILTVDVDIVSPNALGGILDAAAIGALRCRAIAGGANNQLATAADADRLADRGILYAPDYVINAGGILNVALAHLGPVSSRDIDVRVDAIPGRLDRIWDESAATGVSPAATADRMAQALIGRA